MTPIPRAEALGIACDGERRLGRRLGLRVVEAWNRTGISSRVVLTTRALIGMATAIGILAVEDPVALAA